MSVVLIFKLFNFKQAIEAAYNIDKKRVFFSTIQDDNALECLVKKLNIARVPLDVWMLSPPFYYVLIVQRKRLT